LATVTRERKGLDKRGKRMAFAVLKEDGKTSNYERRVSRLNLEKIGCRFHIFPEFTNDPNDRSLHRWLVFCDVCFFWSQTRDTKELCGPNGSKIKRSARQE
jgi:hypothetical protein